MPIQFQFDSTRNILRITIQGAFSLAGFQNTMEQITQSEEYSPDIHALWDLREMDFSTIDEAYWRKILEIRKKHPQRSAARLAHVVHGDFAYGMMRMYQILSTLHSNELKQQVMVFKDIDEAEQWILT